MILAYPDADPAAAAWIDLCEPTGEELERIRLATGLRIPDLHQISEIESSSRLGFEKGAYYLSTSFVTPREDGGLVMVPVGFVLSARVLLTVRFGALAALDAAHEAVAAQQARTADDVFLLILEIVVDRAADKLEVAGATCDQLSRNAFRGGRRTRLSRDLRATLSRIGAVADHTSLIRDALLGIGRIVAYLTKSGIDGAPVVSTARLHAIRTDVASLTDYEGHLSGKVQFLLDATLGFINIEQNEIVKTLTIASVVGIPPTVVAGVYGMNFRIMPELAWTFGYPMAVALIIASAVLPLLWFKRRGWI